MAPSPLKCYIRAHYLSRYFKQFMMRANVNMHLVNEEGMTREDLSALEVLGNIVS